MLREDEEVLGGSATPTTRAIAAIPSSRCCASPRRPRSSDRGRREFRALIDEVEVTGVFVTPQGAVAQVQAADKAKSYLIHVGDQLYDGSVEAIRFDRGQVAEVVFKQDVRDPAAAKPFREVTKKLNPS
jgi:hypothetical protein